MLAEPLAELVQFLVVVSTATLSYDEIDPSGFVDEIIKQFEAKKHQWHNDHFYLPNIIHLFVPPMVPKKLEQLEAIFNSYDFFRHIYRFIADQGFKLFDHLRTEIDVLPGVPTTREGRSQQRCLVRLEWPNTKQCFSGLDVVVEANAERILRVFLPKPEISFFALLQPINVVSYREHFLIVKPHTRLGRARNIIGQKGELRSVNDLPFARTANRVNKTISRIHAIIEFRDDGFYLQDCGSRTGTAIRRFENGWQELNVVKGSYLKLADQDLIRLGDALIAFEQVYPDQLPQIVDRLINTPATGDLEEQKRTDTIARCIKRSEITF